MNKKTIITILGILMITIISCAQNKAKENLNTKAHQVELKNENEIVPHRYGGWYCPDNVKGFPAVDLKNWADVPVITNRLPTKEEARSEASLIFIDKEKYPEAKALEMKLPKLATYYSDNTKKEELIIVIQAVKVQNDSIVGFRYLNGGNGSAWLEDINFINDSELNNLKTTSFVSLKLNINANQDKIWDKMTTPEYLKELQPIFENEQKWSYVFEGKKTVNFRYINNGGTTAQMAEKLFGNMYIQNDYNINGFHYVEKFLLLENEDTKHTELNIVCGPYGDDFEAQKAILTKWAQKVKELSEE